MKITVSTPIEETPRVMQTAGLFDIKVKPTSSVSWDVDLPINEKCNNCSGKGTVTYDDMDGQVTQTCGTCKGVKTTRWNIGLIVGPSGCGKSTIANELFDTPSDLRDRDIPSWNLKRAVVDGFPDAMSIKEITELLSSVGFSSPPAWLKPYWVLSTGQRFRADLARLLAYGGNDTGKGYKHLICDEFTSVVDRTVAQIGSAAVASAVRKRNLKFVAVSCHHDIIPWLQPDWVYRPDEARFEWRLLQRRPEITLEIVRCSSKAWPLFAPHHYLTKEHSKSAVCFLAHMGGQPVAFSSWLPFVSPGPKSRREHRTVVLPDFQGVGVGMAVSDTVASLFQALGEIPRSTTTHPAFIAARKRSKNWKMIRSPSMASGRDGGGKIGHATTRATTGFRYVGPPMEFTAATRLYAERL